MIFGIPLEIRSDEYRVGATPTLVSEIVSREHSVFIETKAGEKSGFSDADYERVGAKITPSPEKLYSSAEYILKVRSPKPVEYELILPDHKIFSFFKIFYEVDKSHSLLSRGCTCFAYEMVKEKDRRPLLDPEFRLSGPLALQQSANYLLTSNGGKGIALNSTPGAPSARVVIIGSGLAAQNTATFAAQCGAIVTMHCQDPEEMHDFQKQLPDNVVIKSWADADWEMSLPHTDILISAVMDIENTIGFKLPNMFLHLLPQDSIVVDLDIDFGGGFEISSKTRWDTPIIKYEQFIYYAVPYLTASVQKTSSVLLSNALLPFVIHLCDHGFIDTILSNEMFSPGLIFYNGWVANERLAGLLGMPHYDLKVNE